ncbi:hypothetical protein BSKO_02086 [Bryopsis sp. KO-2023]|nr:hypothetical protein BSKO_02086 [Bryopsis sp. KO-2023]
MRTIGSARFCQCFPARKNAGRSRVHGTVGGRHRNQAPATVYACRRKTLPIGRSRSASGRCYAEKNNGTGPLRDDGDEREGPSADLAVIFSRMQKLALPYWNDPEKATEARWRLGGVVALTLATTGVSVLFNFLGRDFFNALSQRDADAFYSQLVKYLGGFAVGIPIFVFSGYYQSKLSLEWREWMTKDFLSNYLSKRTFYQIQANSPLDNPDQRISADVKVFTDSALGFVLTILNAVIDLISFSEILFSIYPPLFIALVVYSVGGTGVSLWLGRSLVGLNFQQEAREADFRYGLVRLRENAESIAFYGGEKKEGNLVIKRLTDAVGNFGDLLIASRNLEFFTSFYRYMIALLPAAVIAPLYFKGEIEFGVVTQSQSAFAHILGDVSLVVYQLESLAGFSAVVDRLGQFQEVMDTCQTDEQSNGDLPRISLVTETPGTRSTDPLLMLNNLTLMTPDSGSMLIKDISLEVLPQESLLIMGPSGAGKTSLLRAVAGLWSCGSGEITRFGTPVGNEKQDGDIMFVPQRPYLVLGSLRDQMLYPTWSDSVSTTENGDEPTVVVENKRGLPTDFDLEQMMVQVRLEGVLQRCRDASNKPLDVIADWSTQLSLGEQQRLAFARVLLSKPRLVLMDESTSALDVDNEKRLYEMLDSSGTTYVSVGHRPTLENFHKRVLQLLPGTDDQPEPQWRVKQATPVPSG